QLQLAQDGDNAVLSLTAAASGGDNKQLILLDTDVNDLSASNFAGITGSFTDITIDTPVYYDITASVSGSGGSISPAPDAGGIISARGNRDFTVNFVPDTGYKVASVVVDG